MDLHPPDDDRRTSSGAVVTAWALVACLAATTYVATAFAPARTTRFPFVEQAALHSGSCVDDSDTAIDGNGSLRE